MKKFKIKTIILIICLSLLFCLSLTSIPVFIFLSSMLPIPIVTCYFIDNVKTSIKDNLKKKKINIKETNTINNNEKEINYLKELKKSLICEDEKQKVLKKKLR